MKIDLLIKVQITRWPFALSRETGVENSGAVFCPGCAATRRRGLHVLKQRGTLFPVSHGEEIKIAIFAATLGKRDSNQLTARRGYKALGRLGTCRVPQRRNTNRPPRFRSVRL